MVVREGFVRVCSLLLQGIKLRWALLSASMFASWAILLVQQNKFIIVWSSGFSLMMLNMILKLSFLEELIAICMFFVHIDMDIYIYIKLTYSLTCKNSSNSNSPTFVPICLLYTLMPPFQSYYIYFVWSDHWLHSFFTVALSEAVKTKVLCVVKADPLAQCFWCLRVTNFINVCLWFHAFSPFLVHLCSCSTSFWYS